MATIKTVTIEYTFTFNLGNYSNVRPVVSLTADLFDGDDVDSTIRVLQRKVRLYVEDEIDFALRQAGKAPYFAQLRDGAQEESYDGTI